VNTDIFQESKVVENLNSSQDSINQSFHDFPNEQVIPDADVLYECSIQLPITSKQGSNTTQICSLPSFRLSKFDANG
jgi:hypothetical protein